jgi:RimJ/RimL family protein N-acetyltransferase
MTLRSFEPPDPPLTDGVVQLRSWREEDLDGLVAACQDPEIPRWTLMPDPYTQEAGVDFLGRVPTEWSSGNGAPFCINPAGEPGELIGAIGVFPHEPRSVGGVGYWITRRHRRQGHAVRAIHLLVQWAFAEVGFERLVADVIVGNEASERTLLAAGFTRIGPVDGGIVQRGTVVDATLFGLVPERGGRARRLFGGRARR